MIQHKDNVTTKCLTLSYVNHKKKRFFVLLLFNYISSLYTYIKTIQIIDYIIIYLKLTIIKHNV